MNSVLVDFSPATGWRVRGHVTYEDSIKVIMHNGVKLLHIPSIDVVKTGRFCNPRKLVFSHFYQKHPDLTRA